MKDKEAIKQRILKEEDFIYCPRLGNSIEKLIEINPDGVDDERISKVLLIPEDDVETIYAKALKKIKKQLGL